MTVFIAILGGVLAFVLGAVVAFIFARKSLRLAAIGTLMFEDEDNVSNMYMVWDVEQEDILKHDIALVRIRKWDSRKK